MDTDSLEIDNYIFLNDNKFFLNPDLISSDRACQRMSNVIAFLELLV